MNFLKCKYIPNIAWDITLHYPKNCPSSIWNLNVPVFKPQIFRGAYLYWKLFTVYLKSKFKWVSCYVTSGRATACTYSGMKETDRALSEAPCHLKQWSTLRKKSTLLQLARQGFHGLAHSLPPFPHSFPTRALHSSWDRPISDLRKGPKCLTIPHSGTKICNALPAPVHKPTWPPTSQDPLRFPLFSKDSNHTHPAPHNPKATTSFLTLGAFSFTHVALGHVVSKFPISWQMWKDGCNLQGKTWLKPFFFRVCSALPRAWLVDQVIPGSVGAPKMPPHVTPRLAARGGQGGAGSHAQPSSLKTSAIT